MFLYTISKQTLSSTLLIFYEGKVILLGNVDMLSARSATAARGKFLFLNLLIYFILGRVDFMSESDQPSLPRIK